MRPSKRLIFFALIFSAVVLLIAVGFPERTQLLVIVLIAPLLILILDMLLSASGKNIQAEFDLPKQGFVGTKIQFLLSLTATKRRLPKAIQTQIITSQNIELSSQIPACGNVPAAEITGEFFLRRRGMAEIQTLYLKWYSPLKFFEIIRKSPISHPIQIVPNIRPVTSGQIETQLLPMLDGLKNINIKGEGSEFHQLREFFPGMDTRSIDWKRSARMQNLIAREVRAERNHHIISCVDNGNLMSQSIGSTTKLDLALNASLALCWAGGLGGDQVGFYHFGAKPGQFSPPRPGREAFHSIRHECVQIEYDLRDTNHTWGLSFLNSKLKRRSLIVVFTDFIDTTNAELLIENLALMQKQHLVLYVTLENKHINALINTSSVELSDISISVAASKFKQEREEVLERMRRLGVLVLNAAPEDLTTMLISKYMDIKMQELI